GGGDQHAVGAELAGHHGERGELAAGVVLVDVPHPAHAPAVAAVHGQARERLQAAAPGGTGARLGRGAAACLIVHGSAAHRSLPQAITSGESTDRSAPAASAQSLTQRRTNSCTSAIGSPSPVFCSSRTVCSRTVRLSSSENRVRARNFGSEPS